MENEKRLAAEAAAQLVKSGMTLGLGSGSTVAFFLPALAQRRLSLRCVASSPQTEQIALNLGLHVENFEKLDRLDLTIDGADQISPNGWLIKGRGGAHTREKIIAAASDRVLIIADSSKKVTSLHAPVPVELFEFGLSNTLHQLEPIQLRNTGKSPNGGIIADYHGPIKDPASVEEWLNSIPGVIGHGLFRPKLVTEAWIAHGNSIEKLVF